jgi:hypothetical protein
MYMKELSLVLSRCCGPSRYDPQYEEEGVDYPIGYVRWTESATSRRFWTARLGGDQCHALHREALFRRAGRRGHRELKDTAPIRYCWNIPFGP